MDTDNANRELARRTGSTDITPPLADRGAPAAFRVDLLGSTPAPNVTVRRRRQRVNFRQRYESRGVDSYRDFLRATTPIEPSELDFRL